MGPARKTAERIQLTDRHVRALKARPDGKILEVADAEVRGLHLRVHPTGRRTWCIVLRQMGRFRRFSLGVYPEVGLAKARNDALRQLPELRAGADPIETKRAAKARREATGVETFDDLLDAYERIQVEQLKRQRKGRYWKKGRAVVEAVFKRYRKVPAEHLSPDGLQAALDEKRQTAPIQARIAWETVSPVLRWAEKRRLVKRGLRDEIDPPKRPKDGRKRVLSDDELRGIWKELDNESYPYGQIYKLLLLTGQRLNEVAGMRWGEIDLETSIWNIPEDRMKGNRPHTVPLSPSTVSLLKQTKRECRHKHALVFCTAPGNPIGNWDRAHKRIMKRSKTTGWRRHDLRRVVGTRLGDLGIAPHVISHLQAHANPLASSGAPNVSAIYQRYDYAREVREAVTRWAAALESLLAGQSNVIPLARPDAAA